MHKYNGCLQAEAFHHLLQFAHVLCQTKNKQHEAKKKRQILAMYEAEMEGSR